MLFSLVILCFIASFALQMFTMAQKWLPDARSLNPLEWEVFLNQTKKEVRRSNSMNVVNNTLQLGHGSDIITIEKYQDKLRRRLNGTGHDPMLQNIAAVKFIEHTSAVEILVTDKKGKVYQCTLRPYMSGGGRR
ncbi:competence protein comGF [Bacillus sp. M6-12]|nr:competence protein comGF [Bacillus sp. M6-12]